MEGIREVTLDKIQLGWQQVLSKTVLLDARMDRIEDIVTGNFIYRIDGYIWGEHLPEKNISYPSDWWQAFKARWFPEWLLKRYPAKYTTQHITASIIYPGLNPSIPDRTWRLKMWINEYNEFWSSERN